MNRKHLTPREALLWAGIGLLAAGAIFVWQDWRWAPKCLFRAATGYECPACGMQRAVASLAAGDFRKAFFLNPYLFAIAPYLMLLLAAAWSGESGKRFRSMLAAPGVVACFALLMGAWWIFRNTSFWHRLLTVCGG